MLQGQPYRTIQEAQDGRLATPHLRQARAVSITALNNRRLFTPNSFCKNKPTKRVEEVGYFLDAARNHFDILAIGPVLVDFSLHWILLTGHFHSSCLCAGGWAAHFLLARAPPSVKSQGSAK